MHYADVNGYVPAALPCRATCRAADRRILAPACDAFSWEDNACNVYRCMYPQMVAAVLAFGATVYLRDNHSLHAVAVKLI